MTMTLELKHFIRSRLMSEPKRECQMLLTLLGIGLSFNLRKTY